VLSGEFGEFVGWVGLGGGFVGGGSVFGFPRDDVLAGGCSFGLSAVVLWLAVSTLVASGGVWRALVAAWGVGRRRWRWVAWGAGVKDGSGHDQPTDSMDRESRATCCSRVGSAT
jgi:hypothetical protein